MLYQPMGLRVCQSPAGYTLTELLVVIVILAVLATIALPMLMGMLAHMESMATKNALQNFMSNAKQQAMISQSPVTVCTADTALHCVMDDGKILLSFIDKNNNQNFDTNLDVLVENSPLILRYGTLKARLALAKSYIVLNPMTARPTGYMGHIKYCPKSANLTDMFKMTFSKTGVVKIKVNAEEATDCSN